MEKVTVEMLPFTSTETLERRLKSAINDPNVGPATWLPLLHECAQRNKLAARRRDTESVNELLAAGWTFEPPSDDCEPMSFYWRAPPKGKRTVGRLYRSTNQALTAMRKGQRK